MKKLLPLLLIPFLIGAAPTKQFEFVDGTTIRDSEVDTNFDDLYGYLQTGIDNVRASGIDAITEMATSIRSGSDQTLVTGTAGTNEQFTTWNGDGDLVAVTTMTGNASGINFTLSPTIATITACGTLGTDTTGKIVCND